MSEGSLQPERRSTGVTAKAFFKGKSHQVVSQTADTGQGQSHTSTMGPPPPAKLATAKASIFAAAQQGSSGSRCGRIFNRGPSVSNSSSSSSRAAGGAASSASG